MTSNLFSQPLGGNPQYLGMEFPGDIPPHMVVGSPGGVSQIFHHWTNGFYGQGGASFDKFGHERPLYLHGVYGNLYNKGHTSPQALGMYPPYLPDIRDSLNSGGIPYWENQNIRNFPGKMNPCSRGPHC